MIVVIGVNTLITEAIDTAECMSELNTAQVFRIAIVELLIHRREHRGIHFGHRVETLRNVGTQTNVEFPHLEDRFRAHVEFPTAVFHLTHVGIGHV